MDYSLTEKQQIKKLIKLIFMIKDIDPDAKVVLHYGAVSVMSPCLRVSPSSAFGSRNYFDFFVFENTISVDCSCFSCLLEAPFSFSNYELKKDDVSQLFFEIKQHKQEPWPG